MVGGAAHEMPEKGAKSTKSECACARNGSKADTSLQISMEQKTVSSQTMIGDAVLSRF